MNDFKDFSLPNREHSGKERLFDFVLTGGDLIKKKRYQEAMVHFSDKEKAKKFGLRLEFGRFSVITLPFQNQEEHDSAANRIAMNSFFFPGDKRILLAQGYTTKDIQEIRSRFSDSPISKIQHEAALVYMEEMLHALQAEKGSSLTGQADLEVDVAAFMQLYNIPMTDVFLRRYDRGKILFGNDGRDDSLDSSVAFRRGTFVNVVRSGTGAVENDWQIKNFNTSTGEVVLINFRQGIYKSISRQKLAECNTEGVYPFAQVHSLEDLHSVLSKLQKIQGFQEEYTASQINTLISRVSMDHAQLHLIPRSGGLRRKIAELLQIRSSDISARTELLGIAK